VTRVAAIVTIGDPARIREVAAACASAACEGATVTLFFRDETIPLICSSEVAARLSGSNGVEAAESVAAILRELDAAGDVHCYACSSSLYLWGVSASDLIPEVTGARGLIAFLAEDLAEATEILSA
jgi:peroxiredoxin family protein